MFFVFELRAGTGETDTDRQTGDKTRKNI